MEVGNLKFLTGSDRDYFLFDGPLGSNPLNISARRTLRISVENRDYH